MTDVAPNLPLVIAVVPAFNRCDRTLNFLRNFAAVEYPNKRVVITDDGSTDNTFFNVQLNFPGTEVLRGNGDLWWSGGTNLAIRRALELGADYILTINDDAEMAPDFLTHMVEIARQDPKYIVGCRIHRQDTPDYIWSVGTSVVMRGNELFQLNFADRKWEDIRDKLPNPLPVDTMPGNGVLIPRQVFADIGMYDEQNMPQYHADSDLVLRARSAGYKPVISLNSVVYNHILTKPLVTTRVDLVLSRKSDRYSRAVWTTISRNAPLYRRPWLMFAQYIQFFLPPGLARIMRKLTHRPPPPPQVGGESIYPTARKLD